MHISSGLEALKAAKKVSGKTKIIGVSILTSLDNKALKEIGYNKDVKKLVVHQAKLAQKAQIDQAKLDQNLNIAEMRIENQQDLAKMRKN